MIKHEVFKISGANTEGFNATYENNVLTFSKGIFSLGEREFSYPEGFSFDVVGDNEIPVLYSVFLTQVKGTPSVSVSRVEMLDSAPQSTELEEGEELLHLLTTFVIPAKSNNFDIEVRLLERVVEDEDQSEGN